MDYRDDKGGGRTRKSVLLLGDLQEYWKLSQEFCLLTFPVVTCQRRYSVASDQSEGHNTQNYVTLMQFFTFHSQHYWDFQLNRSPSSGLSSNSQISSATVIIIFIKTTDILHKHSLEHCNSMTPLN